MMTPESVPIRAIRGQKTPMRAGRSVERLAVAFHADGEHDGGEEGDGPEFAAELGDSAPAGIVRITAPPGVAFDFVAPFAGLVKAKYPQIQLQVMARVEYVDLARREADIALRSREPTQRDLTLVHTFSHLNDAFVSKSYRKKLPKKPSMSDIDFIAWGPPFEQFPPNPQLAALIPNFRPSFAADDYVVQLRAAEAGLGAMFLQKVRHRFNRDSNLVPLGLDLGPHATGSLHVVCAKSALGVARVRAVAELLAEELAWAQRTSDELRDTPRALEKPRRASPQALKTPRKVR